MKRPSKKAVWMLAALYAVTWMGALFVYPRDMARRAREEYAVAVAAQQRLEKEVIRPVHPAAFLEGPRFEFHWCVPIAPAVLLVSSDYYIGPLWGHGGLRIVLFYGVGTLETGPIIGWVS